MEVKRYKITLRSRFVWKCEAVLMIVLLRHYLNRHVAFKYPTKSLNFKVCLFIYLIVYLAAVVSQTKLYFFHVEGSFDINLATCPNWKVHLWPAWTKPADAHVNTMQKPDVYIQYILYTNEQDTQTQRDCSIFSVILRLCGRFASLRDAIQILDCWFSEGPWSLAPLSATTCSISAISVQSMVGHRRLDVWNNAKRFH